MLSVMLQWIYLIVILYIIGYGFSEFSGRCLGYRMKSLPAYLMTGMCILTVYAQFFSLIYKVGMLANLCLLALAGVIAVLLHGRLREDIRRLWRERDIGYKALVLFFLVLWAYFTSRGYMVHDTGLYHGQSIRWIEEYGVVKGLGNLHGRFAYNSSVFALHALWSMRFLTGGISLHTANGFLAFILTLTILEADFHREKISFRISDFARIAAAYYLTLITDEIVAPSPDYTVMCVLFYLVITWLDLLERGEEEQPFGLLCVLGVYALTLKLTAGLVLLLTIKPLASLIRKKKPGQMVLFLTLGILVAFPWLLRSVIISGWLIYPLPEVDFFEVDWKMPAAYIYLDRAEIQVWGRALYQLQLIGLPITEWFGKWFRETLSGTEKIWILGDIVSLIYLVYFALKIYILKKKECVDALLLLLTVAASYLYWQTSAPLLRYGYAYVLLLPSLTVGMAVLSINKKGLDRLVLTVLILAAIYKMYQTGRYVLIYADMPYYVHQQDYERFDVTENDLEGLTVYTPKEGDQTGYYEFPAAVDIHARLRGSSFREGFVDNR